MSSYSTQVDYYLKSYSASKDIKICFVTVRKYCTGTLVTDRNQQNEL